MNQNIEIHIEELVLHGFAASDQEGIKAAVENELARLFAVNGLPSSLQKNKNAQQVDAGEFVMQPGAKAHHVGNNIAGSVYKGIRSNGIRALNKSFK